MSAYYSCCNFFMSDRSLYLFVSDVTTTTTCFLIHLIYDTGINWKFFFCNIIFNLLKWTPFIIRCVNCITQFPYAFHRNLYRLVPLSQILGWSIIGSWADYILHWKCSIWLLSIKSILLYIANLLTIFSRLYHTTHMFNYGFTLGFFFSFLFCIFLYL